MVNTYGNEVAQWKTELIVARAKRLGFRRDELEDVQQELILDVLGFRYDATHASGATERTAITSLIDNRLKMIRRSEMRYQTRIEKLDAKPEEDETQDAERTAKAIDGLSSEDRELCDALYAGRSVNEIAVRTGCSWHTIKRRMNRIREHFEALGLDAWVCD